VERMESGGDIRSFEEGGKHFYWEGVECQQNHSYYRSEMIVELLLIRFYITECLFQDLGVEQIDP